MDVAAGVSLIVIGAGAGLLSSFVLRGRLPSLAVALLLAACGTAVGVGALVVQDRAGPGEWAVTLVTLAVLTPLHVGVVLGPLGRRAPRPGGAR